MLQDSSGKSDEKQGKTVRVLIADDSAFMRKVLTEMLGAGHGIEVVGTARDGEDALSKARGLKPDVITLDVEMPNMNGIEFLEALIKELPIPVVMISSLTGEGADVTMACLQRGAVDFVLKPSGSISLDIDKRRDEILQKVRSAAGARVRVMPASARLSKPVLPPTVAGAPRFRTPDAAAPAPKTGPAGVEPAAARTVRTPFCILAETAPKKTEPLDRETIIVAIASSTGGPAALHEVIPLLPADLNAAYVLVQHLPAGFTASLANRLNHDSALAVREAKTGDSPQRGLVLIAPGAHHLALDAQGRVTLNDDPPLWGVRPAADVMMRSVSAVYGARGIGVVLTGMGRDGALGAKAIQQAGGICLAQDEATCVIYGMPRAAVEAGAVAQVVPLQEMAGAIGRVVVKRLAESGKVRTERQIGRSNAA